MCEQPPGSGWVWVSTGARPGSLAPTATTGLHWHRRSLAPAPALRQTEDSSGQASETLFSFSVFFLFVSSFSVVYHTRCIWFARCLYGDYPLSLYRCYWCFLSTTIAPVMFKKIRDIWLTEVSEVKYKSDTAVWIGRASPDRKDWRWPL